MALGQNFNTTKEYSPTLFGYAMYNDSEDSIDTTGLSFSMWKSTIKIAIFPKVNTNNSSNNGVSEWNRKEGTAIYLNHTKAYMFADIIKNFLKDPDKYSGHGVYTAKGGLITISNGKEFGKDAACLIIRKLNTDTGAVESSYAYEFKTKFNASIIEYDEKTYKYEQEFERYKNIEILEVQHQLEEYAKAMTNAIAFTVVDAMNYNNNRLFADLDKIAKGVNVELNPDRSVGNQFGKPNSLFSHRTNKTEDEVSISDLDDID